MHRSLHQSNKPELSIKQIRLTCGEESLQIEIVCLKYTSNDAHSKNSEKQQNNDHITNGAINHWPTQLPQQIPNESCPYTTAVFLRLLFSGLLAVGLIKSLSLGDADAASTLCPTLNGVRVLVNAGSPLLRSRTISTLNRHIPSLCPSLSLCALFNHRTPRAHAALTTACRPTTTEIVQPTSAPSLVDRQEWHKQHNLEHEDEEDTDSRCDTEVRQCWKDGRTSNQESKHVCQRCELPDKQTFQDSTV